MSLDVLVLNAAVRKEFNSKLQHSAMYRIVLYNFSVLQNVIQTVNIT